MKVILGGLEEIKEAMNNELLDDRKRPLSTFINYERNTNIIV